MEISQCENSLEEEEQDVEEEWFYFSIQESIYQTSPSRTPDKALQQPEQECVSQLQQSPHHGANIQQSQQRHQPKDWQHQRNERACQLPAYDEVIAQHQQQPQDRQQASNITPPIMPPQILHCPMCRSGVLTEHFSAVGVLLAVFIFPVGIMFCLLTKEWKCSQCGTVV